MDKSILVVDDEPQILDALKRALRRQKYNIHFANNGEEALEILKQHEVALIMSDYMMPGLNGTELLTKAADIQPNTVRIILSGHSDFQTVLQSIQHGIVHKFLAKPWVNEVLIEQINKALELGVYPGEEGDKSAASLVNKELSKEPKVGDSDQIFEIEISEDNEIIAIPDELAELFGYDVDELITEGLSTLFADHSYEEHLELMLGFDKGSESWELPVKKRVAQTREQQLFSVEISVCFTGEKFICSMKLGEDLVKRKGLDSILKSIHGPYLLIDKAGVIKRYNQKLVDLYGDFHFPDMDTPLQDFIGSCIENGAFPDASEDQNAWYEEFSQFNDDANEHLLKENSWVKIKATHAPKGSKILLHFDVTQKKL